MNKNEKFVITINRELGSGGRTVGCKLAEKLGGPFFDKALITELEKKFHLTLEEIEDLKSQKHSWWADFKRQMSLGEDAVRYYQVEMGKEESCIVAVSTGFYAFRNHPNHMNIFIQAPMSLRVARIMRKRGFTEDKARKTIEEVDKMRENYVKEYTNTSRYDARNYDLVINTDGKTEDELVETIMKFIG